MWGGKKIFLFYFEKWGKKQAVHSYFIAPIFYILYLNKSSPSLYIQVLWNKLATLENMLAEPTRELWKSIHHIK